MATKRILLDSSICIEYFRKKKKANSIFYKMVDGCELSISIITKFEIQIDLISELHHRDYKIIMKKIRVLPLDNDNIDKAVEIYKYLRQQNAQIGLADLLISATAVSHSFPLATLNTKHFERIPNLELVDLSKFKS